MSKIIFLTFSDSKYKKALERIKTQVRQFICFDKCYFLCEKDLDTTFRKSLNCYRHPRGYGYWKWKPYIVKRKFDQMDENDILVYSDVGNWWNINGYKRFTEYINYVKNAKSGMLVFSERYLEKEYTKADLLEYMGVRNNSRYIDSLQIWGGCFIFRKTTDSVNAVNRWYDLHMKHYDLTTDKISKIKNVKGFKCNRHDQSTLSLIVKSYCPVVILNDEVCDLDKNWKTLQRFPIQARRDKERPYHWLSFPWRFSVGLYLIFFERMRFGKIWWY